MYPTFGRIPHRTPLRRVPVRDYRTRSLIRWGDVEGVPFSRRKSWARRYCLPSVRSGVQLLLRRLELLVDTTSHVRDLGPSTGGVARCKRTFGWAVAGEKVWNGRTSQRRAGRGVGAFMECSKLLGSTWRVERKSGETRWVCGLLGLWGEKET